jgi:RNA recognition motif-containing protein
VSTKLYVGNLSYNITNDQLGQLFAQAGTVIEAVVINDRDTGRSKGFGFVTLSSEEEAQKAIATLNESEYEGRKLVVNEARPQAPRENRPYNKDRQYRN